VLANAASCRHRFCVPSSTVRFYLQLLLPPSPRMRCPESPRGTEAPNDGGQL
jgi:hypothetical protein